MKKFLSCICFCTVLVISLMFVSNLTMPKRNTEIAIMNYVDEHCGLYDLPKNTLDVLYLGSSHAFSCISPEDIYKDYGITGYVQASSCQRIWQSYYYLLETLEYQAPKVVVLDVFTMFDGGAQSEPFNREAIDKMRFSRAKLEAIQMAVRLNLQVENFESYILPIIRYHDRWEELEAKDYRWFFDDSNIISKGFLPRIGVNQTEFNYTDYQTSNVQGLEIPALCKEYLEKIKQICDENGITLVLVKYPTCLWDLSKAQAVDKWATDNGVAYLDYNSNEELREKVGIDWTVDTLDAGNHLNYDGAMKMSKVFGEYLIQNFEFSANKGTDVYE